MNVTVAIIEDEQIAREIISKYVKRLSHLSLVAKYRNAIEAMEQLPTLQVDLLFLDIEMPGIDGLSMLKNLPSAPKVIITTAYREYAIESFELNVVDYLLKPISFERFASAVNRVFELKSFSHEVGEPTKAYQYFKSGNKLIQVYLNDIQFIEGLSNYVKIVTDTTTIVVYQKMSYLEEKLSDRGFLRVHKSFIVALAKISAFSSVSVEINIKLIPIGDKYKENVAKILMKKVLE